VYRVTSDTVHSQPNDISPEEFFTRTGSNVWNVLLVTGQRRTAAILSAPGDSITLVSQHDTITIALRQLQSVSRKKRSADALVMYPVVGMIGGSLIGVSSSSNSNFRRSDAGLLSGVAIGIAGGLALGIFLPPEVIYEFALEGDNR
jgi:hypothetical protein